MSGEGGGTLGGRQNPTKGNARPLSVCKIVKFCGVWGEGGGHWGGGGGWGCSPKSYKRYYNTSPRANSSFIIDM